VVRLGATWKIVKDLGPFVKEVVSAKLRVNEQRRGRFPWTEMNCL
jgi:hypothetical protein